MPEFITDVCEGLKSFLLGMRITARYVKDSNLNAEASEVTTTVAYDGTPALAKEVKVAGRFRGHLHNDIERCIVCKACAKACPIDCIWIDGEKNEVNKQRPSRFDIDLLKCMYCGLCVMACPTGSLTMTKEWWGSTFQGEGGNNQHGQLMHFGVGYYTPEERAEAERKRNEAAEAKKKAAAAAAAAKAAADAKKKAEEAAAAKPAATGSVISGVVLEPQAAVPAAGASPPAAPQA